MTKTLGRRTILKALAGAGLTPAPVAGAAVKSALRGVTPVTEDTPVGVPMGGWFSQRHRVLSALHVHNETQREAAAGHLPVHISTKRSWSLAFKSHIHEQERQELHALMTMLENDDVLSRVLEALK